jgi:hypothetical protein
MTAEADSRGAKAGEELETEWRWQTWSSLFLGEEILVEALKLD